MRRKHSFLVCLLGVTGEVAEAQSVLAVAGGDTLTFHGITLYGLVGIGLQYQTHGAPTSEYFPGGSGDVVQKNSNHSVTGVTPSNLGQSRIGLMGLEPAWNGWSALFELETFFNPQSGQLSDGLKSLTENNGRSLLSQSTNLDTSVAGQIFQQSYVGLGSDTFGTITFGRQNTLLADGVAAYDPNHASQAFSLIGLSGTAAGGGDTEDRRLDSSAKYVFYYAGLARFAVQYKFNGSDGSANSAAEFNIGGQIRSVTLDAYFTRIKDAVAVAALSAAQVQSLPGLGLSPSNSLSATISDNTAYALMASYRPVSSLSLFSGYERIKYDNPDTPLGVGFDDIGGYKLAFVNNIAFARSKVLRVFWGGAKYTIRSDLDITAAYYGYRQNSYGTGDSAGCSTRIASTCSGSLDTYSLNLDYRITRRFDAYLGVMHTGVHDGLASGYLHATDMNPTAGIRFQI